MTNQALYLSAWAELRAEYRALLQSGDQDDMAVEEMARRLIETGVPYTEYEAIHAAAVEESGVSRARHDTANALRTDILSFYDRVFADYRKLEQKYRKQLNDQRKAMQSVSNTTSALSVSRDNLRTELSMQQRILAERSTELERLNAHIASQRDEMAGFLYSASHDLKAPMNTVKSLLTLFLTDNAEAGIDLSDVEHAVATATRASVMLDDLLNFSTTLDATPEDETVDLDVLVDDIFRDLSGGETEHHVEFAKDRLPKVNGSEFQLRLLFQNLISNAAKYCPPDRTPRVNVQSKGPRGITYTAVAVVDNGIGIDPSYHEKIFGLFARLHGQQEYPGTGIGLSICQRIIQNHKGQIHLQSEPGKGSTFTVVLPL